MKYNLRLGSKTVELGDPRSLVGRGEPQTGVDSGGTLNEYSWEGQEIDRNELRKVKDIRESGGVVATLFEKKALMKFGSGAEIQSENDDLQQWLDEAFTTLDLLTLDLGSDGVWYPYGLGEIVETRGGDFSHIECVEPWTMVPKTDAKGNIRFWEQELQNKRQETDTYRPEEIGSITLNKASGRDNVGVSEVLRTEEEITQYRENQRAVNKAVEIAGFPHHIWTVGGEGMTPVNDTDLRRVRNLVDNMDGDTQFVVGSDINHDKITPADFNFEEITKRDLRMLTTAIGVPMELAGYGREGMGSGSEAQLIMDTLALENEVSRRRFETQFVEQFVRPVVKEYSPYNPDEEINMQINPFLDQKRDVAELIQKIGGYMTTEEVRNKLNLPNVEDEEIANSYRSPKQVEEAEEQPDQPAEGDGGFGLLNSDGRNLQEVPDNAVSISDPSEAPEGAQTIRGPGGGLYYVPSGDSENNTEESNTSIEPSEVNGENIGDYFEENLHNVDVREVDEGVGIDFDTFPGIDYPIKSSLIVGGDDKMKEGAARFGEIDTGEFENLEDSQVSRAWENMADEVGMTDHDQIEVDIGDFDDTILHMRVNEAFEKNQTDADDFMEDFEELRSVVAGVTSVPPEQAEDWLFEFESGFGVDSSTMREIKRIGESELEQSQEMGLSARSMRLLSNKTGGSGNVNLAGSDTPEWDTHYLGFLETGVSNPENDRLLVSFSDAGVPEMVEERMRGTIISGGLFSDIETVPSSKLMDLRTMFADKLTEDGWTTDELRDAILELQPDLEDYEAERIARSETQHIVNEAREAAYEERGLEDAKFKWVGTDDNRNAEFSGTEICTEIKRRTNPKFGGEPRTLDELREVIEEVHSELDVPTTLRDWTPHINCRHTYVRHVE
jgi:hypothetical protein